MRSFQAAVVETETLLAKYKAAQKSVPAFNPESIPGRRRFLSRRVKLLRNVLQWRKYTGEGFGLGLLVGRLVEGCILSVAESGWDVGGEKISRIVSSQSPTCRDHANLSLGCYNVAGRAQPISFKGAPYIALNVSFNLIFNVIPSSP